MFFSVFWGYAFTLRSLTHLEGTFVNGVKQNSNFLLFSKQNQLSCTIHQMEYYFQSVARTNILFIKPDFSSSFQQAGLHSPLPPTPTPDTHEFWLLSRTESNPTDYGWSWCSHFQVWPAKMLPQVAPHDCFFTSLSWLIEVDRDTI